MVEYKVVIFSMCVIVMVMPSAYEESCSGPGGRGMSDVYMLKGVVKRTPP